MKSKKRLVTKIQLVTKLNIILTNLKKEDVKYKTEDSQPCRKLIAEKLAIHLIPDIKRVKAGEPKIKLGFTNLIQ